MVVCTCTRNAVTSLRLLLRTPYTVQCGAMDGSHLMVRQSNQVRYVPVTVCCDPTNHRLSCAPLLIGLPAFALSFPLLGRVLSPLSLFAVSIC